MARVVFFHLYNDFSGSPMVLRTVVEKFIGRGVNVELLTSRGGCLDSISEFENYKRFSFFYKFSDNPVVTVARFVRAQLYMFFFAFRYVFSRDTVFYINTILPVGPALAGRLLGKRVVYHCHENAWMKGRVYKELSRMMTWIADVIICVSDYQRNTLNSRQHAEVVPNAVSDKFRSKLHSDARKAFANKEILMACSPKMYKGIGEFVCLAYRLPKYHFTLVLNSSEKEKERFVRDNHLSPSPNTAIVSRAEDMSRYYNNSSMVLNLSEKNLFIETFGMTVMEGMCAGLPCIVPDIGGVRELVEEGVNGWCIDSRNIDDISGKIDFLLSNEEVYMRMSQAALERSCMFSENATIENIFDITCRK